MEALREAAAKEKQSAEITTREGETSLVTRGEMRNILHDLMAMGMMGPKSGVGVSELKLESLSSDMKLEGSKNYLS